jgi:hypothetical protein
MIIFKRPTELFIFVKNLDYILLSFDPVPYKDILSGFLAPISSLVKPIGEPQRTEGILLARDMFT